MAAPRFFTLPRTLMVLSAAVLLAAAVISNRSPSWLLVLVLAGITLIDALQAWRLEVQLHHQRRLANYYEDALHDVRKELDRG